MKVKWFYFCSMMNGPPVLIFFCSFAYSLSDWGLKQVIFSLCQCAVGCLRVTRVSKVLFVMCVAAIMNQRFDPHFPLQHQQKDLRLVLSMGDSVEQPLYLAAAANEVNS